MHRFKSDVSWKYQANWEEIITDVAKVSHINAILLRYFNDRSTSFRWNWELPIGVPQNLVPFITQTGFDYEKSLCLRRWLPNAWRNSGKDYIHVVDLAKAHVIALQRLLHKRMLLKSKHST
jgi:UDP-glucose 4-epimerase